MTSNETYSKFAQFYDTYVGGFRADLPLYLSLCDGCGRILEIGCGTGRVLQALLEAGHNVAGVDISLEMLGMAARKLAGYLDERRLVLIEHDFRLSPLEGQFARVLVTFYTFNYLLEEAEQSAFLRNIFAALKSPGLVVIDLFHPKSKARPETEDCWIESVYEMEGRPVVLKQKKKMIDKSLEERIQVYTDGNRREEIQTLRRYNDKRRMYTLLSEAGFTKIRFTNGYDPTCFRELNDKEETTADFVVMARKP